MDAAETKSCSLCKEVKPLEAFSPRSDRPKGRASRCKVCNNAVQIKFRAENPGYVKQCYEDNKEADLARSKKYYEANRETRLARMKWRQREHPELYAYCAAKRRAAKLRATVPGFDQEIKEIYKNRPTYHHVDHIVPLQGENVCGLHVPWNLQYLPATENLSKGNKLVCYS